MNMALALMNAQRRPEDEARRITEAMGAALVSAGSGEGSDGAAIAAAVQRAIGGVNEQIADEKSPRLPQSVPEGLRAEFDETPDLNITDETAESSPELPPLLTSHLLTTVERGPAEAPGATEETRPAEASGPAMETRPPWDTTPADIPETAERFQARVGDGNVALDQDDHADVPAGGDGAAAALDLGEDAEPYGDANSATEDTADADDTEPWIPRRAPQPRVSSQPPSPTDSYAVTVSSWGDGEELEIPMGTVASPAPGTDDTSDPSADDDDDDEPVPSTRATDPPADIDIPEPTKDESLPQRARAMIARTLRDRRKALRIGVLASAALIVIIVIAVFSLSGGRGEPPTPAGTLPPQPVQSDNPEPTPTGGVLLPSTVSASCGNDSDPVAPFAGEKSRAWVCTRINGLDLNVLNITFDKPVVITSITIVPGFNYVAPDGRDEWSRHRLISAVSWRMGGAVYPQVINPTRTGVTKQFDAVQTEEISMTVTASTRPPLGKDQTSDGIGGAGDADDPSKVDDTSAVSQIIINGYPVDPGS